MTRDTRPHVYEAAFVNVCKWCALPRRNSIHLTDRQSAPDASIPTPEQRPAEGQHKEAPVPRRTLVIARSTLEAHRHKWLSVAYANGWARDPFPVQLFVRNARVVDSVSFASLDRDMVTDSHGRDLPFTIDEEA